MRRVFFLRMSSLMEMPTKQTYSKNDMSLLPDTSILVEVNTLRRTKKTYIITCTIASPVHQPKHSSKQRRLRLKRCFLMVSAPKPLKQQSFNNKSFRNHCKGNVFFPDLKNLDAEKHKHRTVLPPSTGETKLPIVFLGVRFRLSWPGKIGIPQWKRQMAYPGAR